MARLSSICSETNAHSYSVQPPRNRLLPEFLDEEPSTKPTMDVQRRMARSKGSSFYWQFKALEIIGLLIRN